MAYDLITAKLNETTKQRFLTACDILTDAVAAGAIANTVFQDAKSVVDRVLNDQFHAAVLALMTRTTDTAAREAEETIYYSYPSLHNVAGKIKAISKITPDVPAKQPALDLLRDVLAVAEAVAAIKSGDMIKKRQPKTGGGDPRFQAPKTSSVAAKRVEDLLTALVEDRFQALIDAMQQRYQGKLQSFIKLRDKLAGEGKALNLSGYARLRKNADINFLSRVLTDNRPASLVVVVRDDAEAIIATQARKDAEEARTLFVAKNLRKIVAILEAKEAAGVALAEAALTNNRVSLSGLEGTFRVSFADGSHFVFHNAVVFATSMHGVGYVRFPLTFHSVTLPGGAKMPRPSEERMNTVFLGR